MPFSGWVGLNGRSLGASRSVEPAWFKPVAISREGQTDSRQAGDLPRRPSSSLRPESVRCSHRS